MVRVCKSQSSIFGGCCETTGLAATPPLFTTASGVGISGRTSPSPSSAMNPLRFSMFGKVTSSLILRRYIVVKSISNRFSYSARIYGNFRNLIPFNASVFA
jgi:hypothetical protein